MENNSSKNAPGLLKRILAFKNLGIFLILILIIVVTQIVNPNFLSTINVTNMLRKFGMVTFLAVGMTYVIVSGGIDLSAGALACLGGIVAGTCMKMGLPLICTAIIPILACGVFGAANGLMITKIKLPPFIATLGMMYICQGAVNVISGGKQIVDISPEYVSLFGKTTILGFPLVCWVAVLFALVAHFVLEHTVYGRSLMSVGGNERVARTSGINVNKTRLIAYTFLGVGAALTGMFTVGRLNAAHPAGNEGWEMTAIAAAIIGGTSVTGGVGSVAGTMIGTGIMVVIEVAMVMLKVDVQWQNIVIGVIIILAVAFDRLKRSRE